MNCSLVCEAIIFDLHDDEWSAWQCMGVPDQHYTVTNSTLGVHWNEIHIHPEWREQFLIMARLLDWNSGYFDQYYGKN
jgi:hypothetical protein